MLIIILTAVSLINLVIHYSIYQRGMVFTYIFMSFLLSLGMWLELKEKRAHAFGRVITYSENKTEFIFDFVLLAMFYILGNFVIWPMFNDN